MILLSSLYVEYYLLVRIRQKKNEKKKKEKRKSNKQVTLSLSLILSPESLRFLQEYINYYISSIYCGLLTIIFLDLTRRPMNSLIPFASLVHDTIEASIKLKTQNKTKKTKNNNNKNFMIMSVVGRLKIDVRF